ncbi:MAG: ankyrin repeat domain-containing protein [Capsulimonas sp.]|uniref:ankyrin repeat domain-containing protein n=1 Tax=Capsulimonas sp. TaxID=2494211 RepID=UPI003263CB55
MSIKGQTPDDGTPDAVKAVQESDLETLKQLVEERPGLPLSYDHYGRTLLHFARHGSIAKFLIDCGANVNELGWMESTPLHNAAGLGDIDVVRTLLENGADVNAPYTQLLTPLHSASGNRSEHGPQIVQMLIDAGADIEATTTSGVTPLLESLFRSAEENLPVLLAAGACIDVRDLRSGHSVFHYVAIHGLRKSIRRLVEAGADLNAQDKLGDTALHLAVRKGDVHIVQLLCESGADRGIANVSCLTPVLLAMELPQLVIAEYFRSLGDRFSPGKMVSISVHAHSLRREAISVERGGALARWGEQDGRPQLLARVEIGRGALLKVCAVPEADQLLLLFPSGKIELWDWNSLKVLHSFKGALPKSKFMALSDDGAQIAVIEMGGEDAYVLKYPSLELIGDYAGGEYPQSLAVHADAPHLAVKRRYQEAIELEWFDTSLPFDEDLDHILNANEAKETYLAFSPDGIMLASVEWEPRGSFERDASLCVYDLTSDSLLWTLKVEIPIPGGMLGNWWGPPYTEPIFLDMERILWGNPNGALEVYSARDGAVLSSVSIDEDKPLYSVSVGANGALVWAVKSDGDVVVCPARAVMG